MMLRAVFTGIAFLFITLRDEFEGAITSFTQDWLGVEDSLVGVFIVALVLGLAFALFFGWIRLGPKQWTFSHTQTIPASPASVWDAINPRPRSDPFEDIIQRIDKVPGEQGMFHYVRRKEVGHDETIPIEVYVVDGVREQALQIETHTPDDLYHLYEFETDTYRLQKVDGGTRVSLTLTLNKPSFYFVICCMIGSGPAKSTMDQLSKFTRRAPVSRRRGAMFGRHA